MKNEYLKKMGKAAVVVAAAALAGMWINASQGQAQAQGDSHDSESRIQQGFAIAPVPLNLHGKNRAQVGMGSYLVNAVASCNECHTNPSYAPGGNPFLGQPGQINTAGYLGGGMTFGPFISRNITPDKTGMPGGHTFSDFVLIMRTGVDFDHVHPPLPLLQVMPWPVFQNMTDHDLRAIYEYLSAIPCVEGGPGEPPNRCH